MNEEDDGNAVGTTHAVPQMHERTIELADGRYMIFFTFTENEPAADRPNTNV
ncbi:MAG: hypothetical protein ACR2IH_13565 [Pyrinomonadaceae bacterium]